jgi:Uma2 family endonuclease
MPEPVLLVEILSPSNYRQSRANVWTYMTLPSVRDVLLVHSTRIEAELLSRQPDGSWPAEPLLVREGGTLTLDGIGLALPLRALYRTTSLAA